MDDILFGILDNSTVTQVPDCLCDGGPTRITCEKSHYEICSTCGKVLSKKLDNCSSSYNLQGSVEVNSKIGEKKDLGIHIQGYYNNSQNWNSNRDLRALRKKVDTIRTLCFKHNIPINIINEACTNYRVIDAFKKKKKKKDEKGVVNRARPLYGLYAACLHHALIKIGKHPLSNKEILSMFHIDGKILDGKFLTRGIKLLENALRDMGDDTEVVLDEAEKRLIRVSSFIEYGAEILSLSNTRKSIALYLASRINELPAVKTKKHKTIYIAVLAMTNERYPTKGITSNKIFNILGSTGSTTNTFKNDIRKNLQKKYFKNRRDLDTKKKCYATDEIYNSEFPHPAEIEQWAKEFNEQIPKPVPFKK